MSKEMAGQAQAAAGVAGVPLIVVVEDEAIVLAGYQILLESVGFRVVAAASLEEALAELAPLGGEVPGCILADYRLKDGQTGLDAIAAIRQACHAEIPAMLVTGDTAVDRLRSAAASGLPILHKPVNGTQLVDALKRLL